MTPLTTAYSFASGCVLACVLSSAHAESVQLQTTQPRLACARSSGPCVATFRASFSDPRRAGEVATTVPVQCRVKATYGRPHALGYGQETSTYTEDTYAQVRAGVIEEEVSVELRLPASAEKVLLPGLPSCTASLRE